MVQLKTVEYIALGLFILIGGFLFVNGYIYKEKQGNGGKVEAYRGTLSGEVVCLPHKNTEGPQTLECAFGLKTLVGEYYALDLSLLSQIVPDLPFGETIEATGLITPIALLSSDMWQRYPIEGIFSITDSFKTLPSSKPLSDTEWMWLYTNTYGGGQVKAPETKGFRLSFIGENRVTSTTDCNTIAGGYVRTKDTLSFTPFISTKMYCEGSYETEYVKALSLATSYKIEGDILHINLDKDAGVMVFTRTY